LAANNCLLYPKGFIMSFKKFSTSQPSARADKSADKAKAAPAGGEATAKPADKQADAGAAKKS
jgi:hypothetical protein